MPPWDIYLAGFWVVEAECCQAAQYSDDSKGKALPGAKGHEDVAGRGHDWASGRACWAEGPLPHLHLLISHLPSAPYCAGREERKAVLAGFCGPLISHSSECGHLWDPGQQYVLGFVIRRWL